MSASPIFNDEGRHYRRLAVKDMNGITNLYSHSHQPPTTNQSRPIVSMKPIIAITAIIALTLLLISVLYLLFSKLCINSTDL
jgi:hypothetical protein